MNSLANPVCMRGGGGWVRRGVQVITSPKLVWQWDRKIFIVIQIVLKLMPFHYRAKEKRNRLSLLVQKPEFHEDTHSSKSGHLARDTRWITFNYWGVGRVGGDFADFITKDKKEKIQDFCFFESYKVIHGRLEISFLKTRKIP